MTLAELFAEGARRGITSWDVLTDTATGGLPQFCITSVVQGLPRRPILAFKIDIDTFGKEFLIPAQSNEYEGWL